MQVPNTEFEHALTLPGGVEVRHVGGGHAADSTVVAVPDSGVLVLGELLTRRRCTCAGLLTVWIWR
ncbi:hypothetical protein ACPB67_23760 [Micromonospora taraxaci]|uniref:hypothetical protein n=1 Tax=Micromonospora taraxaci TaxID=1316803 RepID=UPI003C2EBB3A